MASDEPRPIPFSALLTNPVSVAAKVIARSTAQPIAPAQKMAEHEADALVVRGHEDQDEETEGLQQHVAPVAEVDEAEIEPVEAQERVEELSGGIDDRGDDSDQANQVEPAGSARR